MARSSKTVPLDKVGAGLEAVAKKEKDESDRQEELAAGRHRAETTRIKEFNLDLRVNRSMRHDYAKLVFRYLLGYSAFAAVVIILDGWKLADLNCRWPRLRLWSEARQRQPSD